MEIKMSVEENIVDTKVIVPTKRKSKGKNKSKTKSIRKAPFKRQFPKDTVLNALKIAVKIKELNGGRPWESKEVAKAVGIGFSTNNFYYLTAASRDYGLTNGSSKTTKLDIADLGKQILYAPDSETEKNKKLEAFLNIPIFKSVLNHYKGSNLPEMKYLGNTLEKEFKLPPDYHEEFAKVFRENCKELGITSGDNLEQNIEETKRPTTIKVGEPPKGSKSKLKYLSLCHLLNVMKIDQMDFLTKF
jgi:hypothetical protein